jgi:hypothetical protein
MSVRFTAYLSTGRTRTIYADTVMSDELTLKFCEGISSSVVESVPAPLVRMLFRDADDRVG